jgi:2-polyprenyl-3-methyl-5-hydroxy-6-metoxy-1,4-benzoquinol methylase
MARGPQEDERPVLILTDDQRRERLISDEYRRQQVELHEDENYGVASTHFAPLVAKVVNQYGVDEMLDYGAGKGRLAQTLIRDRLIDHPMRIQHYEPAVVEWADMPEPCEMVACLDVLEHIEPALLDNVLDDLQRVTKSIGLFTVSTVEAMKVLPDGRNAHLIVEPASWWLPKILERWDLHVFQKTQDGFMVLVMANEIERQ